MSRNGRSLAWILNNVVRKFSGYHAIHINGEFLKSAAFKHRKRAAQLLRSFTMHKDVLFDSEMLLTLFTNISVVLFIILYSPLAAANQAAILFTISFISMLNEIIFQLLSSVQMLYNLYGNLMIKRNCNTV